MRYFEMAGRVAARRGEAAGRAFQSRPLAELAAGLFLLPCDGNGRSYPADQAHDESDFGRCHCQGAPRVSLRDASRPRWHEAALRILRAPERGHEFAIGNLGNIPAGCCDSETMGRHVTLPLYGTATFSRGVSTAMASSVVRLRSRLDSPAALATDFELVRSKEELQAAAESRRGGVKGLSR